MLRTTEPRKSLHEAKSGLPGHLKHTTQEDSNVDTLTSSIGIPEGHTETDQAAPARKGQRRPSSAPTSHGTRKTSFMLGQVAQEALAELMPMWGFPSKGEAVTHALLYLLHQSKADAVSRLPLEQE